ncbi:S24 family peptidase [Oleiagrimonas sp.]|uniref:LexA family protein n=1 Tax=Oleiagrimonas sp. TaxID=2010330 RepID=UPI0026216774|nr:S24 family peptidase [Oleiagrimonas sp.]MDA3912849.1 S24 family peptidase [Oleiagrimonas sp.]
MNTSNHGGPRPGAGRKPGFGAFGEPTRPIRIPQSQVPTVVAFLGACREPTRGGMPIPMSSNLSTLSLPAFAHQVPAGFPSPADDYLDDTIDFNKELIVEGHEAATFVLRVTGWSMMGSGIHDGDRVVVDRAVDPREGDIVVANIDNEYTIKRLGKVNGKLALLPDNPHFKPRILEEGDTLEIWGVVVSSVRTFKRGG